MPEKKINLPIHSLSFARMVSVVSSQKYTMYVWMACSQHVIAEKTAVTLNDRIMSTSVVVPLEKNHASPIGARDAISLCI